MTAVIPDPAIQNTIQASIFDAKWGLKAQSTPPSSQARAVLLAGIEHLKEKGADTVILGCTELPLAVSETEHDGTPLISSTRALARGLIQATHPDKLRPLPEALAA